MKLPPFLAARSRSEKRALAALGIVLLGAIGVTLMSGSSEEIVIPPFRPTITKSPTPTPTNSPLPVTDTMFGRDPFEPLVREQTDPGPAPTGSPTGGTSGGTATSKRVTLLDIFRSGSSFQATVSVDGTEFTVSEGETFDTSFRLLSLTSRCGTFVFGDERFTLCIGQEVRK